MPKGALEIEAKAASPDFRYIVGYVSTQTVMREFLWKNGVFQYLSSQDSVAWSVNDSGKAVGETLSDSVTSCAVIWSDGKERRLFPDDASSRAQGVDNAGNVFGVRVTRQPAGENAWRAYTCRNDGSIRYLDYLDYLDAADPKSNILYHASNQKGQLALYQTDNIDGYQRSLLWNGKSAQDLPSPQKGKRCLPRSMNETGDVVGTYFPDSSTTVPVLWKNRIPALMRLPRPLVGEAVGINDRGGIIGNASLRSYGYPPFLIREDGFEDIKKYRETPFLIQDGTFYSLNDLVINKADIRRTVQISRTGVILADGFVGKERHAFLLKPIMPK
ncbi:MAG: hypothetical protein V4671_12850 [Armatimonadota bacterium]